MYVSLISVQYFGGMGLTQSPMDGYNDNLLNIFFKLAYV